MKYMGSKSRIAKHILPIMMAKKGKDQWWVEPFVGGANTIDKVQGKRIGADINEYLIEALILIRDRPETIPNLITEQDYEKAKSSMTLDGLTGFIGFAMSFGGKFFGGYRRDVAGTKGCISNMQTQTRRAKQNAIKQTNGLQGVIFETKSYLCLQIPSRSLIYCDPPYKSTTKYRDNFDHHIFWQWCRNKSKEGHTVFVSEYEAPNDFDCVWEKDIAVGLRRSITNKKPKEKLFMLSAHGETK